MHGTGGSRRERLRGYGSFSRRQGSADGSSPMRYVSLLLHLYQPPTQDIRLVRRIDSECYTPLANVLAETGARVGVNINYSLTEQLAVIDSPSLRSLASADGIEFTDSGAYHPIFPLIEQSDIVRQLSLNSEGNRRLLGDAYSPSGVFPPEMAYWPGLPGIIERQGYRWTVTDDLPWDFEHGEVPFDTVPAVDGVAVLLRSNFWSNRISFHGDSAFLPAPPSRQVPGPSPAAHPP